LFKNIMAIFRNQADMQAPPAPGSVVRTTGQLGPALRALRQVQGWSQTELGRRVGLSQERVSAIERHPERVTVGQLLTVLMALQAQLRVEGRPRQPDQAAW
jgi:HTH-type transcriptional regulator/antitoxin HipB